MIQTSRGYRNSFPNQPLRLIFTDGLWKTGRPKEEHSPTLVFIEEDQVKCACQILASVCKLHLPEQSKITSCAVSYVCVWRCIIIRFHTLSPDMSCFSEFEAFLFLPCSHETSLDWFTVIPLIKTNRCIFYNHLILNLSNSYSLTSEPFPVYRCPIHGGLFQKTNNGAQRDAIQRSSYCLSHRGSTKHNIIWRGGGMIMCVCVCARWCGWGGSGSGRHVFNPSLAHIPIPSC